MNKFQAMAQIMAFLCEDGSFPKGSHRYKLARKFIATKIDTMGPDAAYNQDKWANYQLLWEIEELEKAEGKMGERWGRLSLSKLGERWGRLSLSKLENHSTCILHVQQRFHLF